MVSTVNKGYDLPATGSLTGTWGLDLNAAVFTVIDNNLGGVFTIPLSNANVVVSAANAQNCIYRLTGTLTADVQVTLPVFGFFFVENFTTGNFQVKLTNGAGASIILPIYTSRHVISDSVNGVRAASLPVPGTLHDSGAINGTATALHRSYLGEYLLCDGSAVSRSTYPALFQAVGTNYGAGDGSTTFNVPDLRGRVRACIDLSAGRVTTLAGIGSAGGEQYHQLTQGEMPSHNHGGVTGNDAPDHTHTTNAAVIQASNAAGGQGQNQTFPQAQISSGRNSFHQHPIQIQGNDIGHNNIQPTMLVFTMIKT